MTRLEKYLLSIAHDVIDAETTSSRYMIVNGLKIRVSDHYSNNTDADLQIILPYNRGPIYTVIIKDSQKFLCYNTSQIKDLIPYLALIKGLKSPFRQGTEKGTTTLVADKIAQCKAPILNWDNKLVISKLDLPLISKKERGIINREKTVWEAHEIMTLKAMLHKEFGRNDGINDDFQIFLTCTSLTYKQVLNIYKIIVINNPNKKATIMQLRVALLMVKEIEELK